MRQKEFLDLVRSRMVTVGEYDGLYGLRVPRGTVANARITTGSPGGRSLSSEFGQDGDSVLNRSGRRVFNSSHAPLLSNDNDDNSPS